MPASPSPVRYSPEIEDIRPDEQDTIAGLNAAFDEILQTTSKDYGRAVRSVHAKAHGIIEGRMRVAEDLPPELAQGLFATSGEHRVFLRFSTNAGDILPDTVALPRGLAMKVLDAKGERLEGAEGSTQDFVMVNGPVFLAKTADKFLSNLKLLAKTTDRGEGAKEMLSSVLQVANKALSAIGIESSTLRSMGGAPNVDPLGETYFSVTPFRYGDFVAKFSVKPVSGDLVELEGREIDASGNDDAVREAVRDDMRTRTAVWEFRVQLCRDLAEQPVEDPTVEWTEDKAPFHTVATITADPQDSWDPAQVRAVDEEMRFSIWTGLAAHRPLGNINRARRETYRHSSDYRAAFNRCPIHEPAAT